MKLFEVLAVGDANIDTTIRVSSLPKHDDKVLGEKVTEQVGGTVANSACVLGSLGAKVAVLAKVGTDSYGIKTLDEYTKYSIDTMYVEQIAGHHSNQAIVMLDDTGEKSLIFVPTTPYEYSADKVLRAVSNSQYMYTMPGNIGKFIDMASLARKFDTKVVVDIEPTIISNRQDTDDILRHSDIVFFNEEGFKKAIESEPSEVAMTEILERYKLSTVVVTLGSKGVVAAEKNEFAKHDGFKVKVVDTTGAGDTFNASFLFSKINNYSLSESLEFACAAAAYSIGGLGPKGAVPTRDVVEQFIVESVIV
ncbi:carbohydrate kinase family protein [Vibrio splendidus]|uniref:carbohydrate kinase family protein n=1 Tax=Vibrio splendidus TaxID=29497 RepID=UPI0006CA4243|nr:carbohydrate kinase family protein [Vibrio splendidus]KPM01477.1 hypothetical protein AN167_02890 [Vibrio splendidus]